MANNQKMNISYRIRAIDNFSKTHDKLERQLAKIKTIGDDLGKGMEDVKIDADTSDFDRGMRKTERKLASFPKRVWVHIQGNFNETRSQMDRLATGLRTFGEVSRGAVSGGIFMALPALVPILGTAAGGIMAMASALTTAGIGAAGFAAVAIPSIKGVFDATKELEDAQKAVNDATTDEERAEAMKELERIQDSLTDSQKKSVKALQDYTSWFGKFRKQFETPVLDIFNASLTHLKDVLLLSQPAIESTIDAIKNLQDSFSESLKADDVKAFFDWVGETAGPRLETLVKSVGNFFMGLMNMFVAFDPLAESFSEGLLNMSERFREWSDKLKESDGLQKFIDFVRENAPTVLELIGNIVTTFVNMGIAMAPMAEKVLEVANSFFAWTSELFKNNEALGMVAGIISVLIGAAHLLFPVIFILVGAFKTVWPVISTVFSWLGKLVGGFMRVFPFVKRMGTVIRLLAMGPLGLIIATVGILVVTIVKNWDTIWATTKKVFGAIGDFISGIWDSITGWIGDAVSTIKTNVSEGWQNMKDNISNFGSKISDNVSKGWQNIKDNISDAASGAWKAVKGKFGDMVDSVKGKMSDVKGKVEDGWGNVTDFLGGIDLFDIGKNIIDGMIGGIKSMGKKLVDSAKGVVDGAINGAKKLLGIKSPSRVFKQIGVYTGEGFVVGMDNMVRNVGKASQRMADASIPELPSAQPYSGSGAYGARNNYENARNKARNQTEDTGGRNVELTQHNHFHGDSAKTPSQTARRNKQALRDWGMEADI